MHNAQSTGFVDEFEVTEISILFIVIIMSVPFILCYGHLLDQIHSVNLKLS